MQDDAMTGLSTHPSHRTLLLSWLALVILSVITVSASGLPHPQLTALVVLLAGFSKAWIIIDQFMELRHSTRIWRLLMLGWPLVMAIAIGAGIASR